MNILITPHWNNRGPAEQLEFSKLIQNLSRLGYSQLLLSYTDGSVLLRPMTQEEIKSFHQSENDE